MDGLLVGIVKILIASIIIITIIFFISKKNNIELVIASIAYITTVN